MSRQGAYVLGDGWYSQDAGHVELRAKSADAEALVWGSAPKKVRKSVKPYRVRRGRDAYDPLADGLASRAVSMGTHMSSLGTAESRFLRSFD